MATSLSAARVASRAGSRNRIRTRLTAKPTGEALRLALLVALAVAVFAVLARFPEDVPRSAYAPLILLAGLMLSLRHLVVYYGVVLGCLAVGLVLVPTLWNRALIIFLVLVFMMATMLVLARSREGLGVYGTGSEALLRDLRQRHSKLGEIPTLPEGWHAEGVIAGANGDTFLGDVLLSAEGFHPHHAEFCLVDVSGKGLRAGTRAMTLAAALSGLLGQVEPWRFLQAANSYLVRQQWAEGFATAVHLDLDPVFGHFSVSSAGHPPAMRYSFATGTWEQVTTEAGPALGLMDNMNFPRISGELHPGDALVLYTDGIIESRENELAGGIDWMGGIAERALRDGSFSGLAKQLTESARGGPDDDRAALVIWRL
ncbi:putative integral membrane protein [Nostocoides australiense Ben110]|uniref:Putative integral membrane protein n=1 Tax=Nostocoides australiense Ben110 TaxID=1193182 RepID=W6JT97_9MICO|nr:putative integral membrane protein [Tetrasphaera australiensis Ben110]